MFRAGGVSFQMLRISVSKPFCLIWASVGLKGMRNDCSGTWNFRADVSFAFTPFQPSSSYGNLTMMTPPLCTSGRVGEYVGDEGSGTQTSVFT